MMKILTITILFLSLSLGFSKTGLKVKESTTLIYSHATGTSILGTLKSGDNVYLLERGEIRSKVKTRSGLTGWVKNTATEFAEVETGRDYVWEARDVSFILNLSPVQSLS